MHTYHAVWTLTLCICVTLTAMTSAAADEAHDLGDEGNDLEKRGVKLSVNNGLEALADSFRQQAKDSHADLFRLGKRPSFSFNQDLKSLADAYGRDDPRARLLSLGKRLALSVNGGLQSLADSMKDPTTHNQLLSLGKRPSFSVNHGLNTLASAMGPSRSQTKLLSLGKRMQLSFNQGLQSLASSFQDRHRNRLMDLGKRGPLSINNELHSLAHSMGGPLDSHSSLLNLGKRGPLSMNAGLHSLAQSFKPSSGDSHASLLSLGKRAPFSVNAELRTLANSFGRNHNQELLNLGKRTLTDSGEEFQDLAQDGFPEQFDEKDLEQDSRSDDPFLQNDAEQNAEKEQESDLEKRAHLSIGQELQSLSDAYRGSKNHLLSLGKRVPFSVGQEMHTLGNAMREQDQNAMLLRLGKRSDFASTSGSKPRLAKRSPAGRRLSINSELWSLAQMARDSRSQRAQKDTRALLDHLGKRSG